MARPSGTGAADPPATAERSRQTGRQEQRTESQAIQIVDATVESVLSDSGEVVVIVEAMSTGVIGVSRRLSSNARSGIHYRLQGQYRNTVNSLMDSDVMSDDITMMNRGWRCRDAMIY